ncbi:unnamed protein product [Diatraea saccharalis]|uniref:Cytosolic endo-beta-N-acetylglucosaminidase TIM barrel domain-containing protein n=1 Tax=Diatraea saccharalis TaxID=40085 RepID=A0A9N9WBH8_9NEOP|nr:unnamed protein product [Diatraea saccharalis]
MSVLLDELTCKPLDTYSEIELFLENPPAWRTLCKELQPHSKYLLKNSSLIGDNVTFSEPGPATFCHFDPDDTLGHEVRHEEKKLPKTLVCHDMANGYHDDCKIDGTGTYDAYTFYNWAGIDIFCYFSHHLITIPPLGWINVGHAHGVKVIGTVITEWSDGQAFWDKLLESEDEYKVFASALVAIAKTLKFDGWLLNIENKVLNPGGLLEFVEHLHKTLHKELRDPVLIWYDSVTIEGTLNWQNALNKRNKPFFDACDGIFTNYSWTGDHIKESALEAGERLTDLYIGIDVWGRNFYGGGQFNTHEAMNVAYSYGCSIAIFAPAWTHEAVTSDKKDINSIAMADDLEQYEQFLLRDRALWDCIWPFLNTRVPSALPFKTSFCRGQGKKRRLYGEVLCPVPWYNLRHMQYQPNCSHGPHRYIMTENGKITQKSQKDKKGIIKYHEEVITDENEIGGTSHSECVNELDEKRSVKLCEIAVQTEQQSVKKKIKNIFKNIFKMKISKTEEQNVHKQDNEEEVEVGRDEKSNQLSASKAIDSQMALKMKSTEDSVSVLSQTSCKDKKEKKLKATGKSMIWMSMNINLGRAGQSAVTRYHLTFMSNERDCLQVYFEDSFTGGSCLKVHPCEKLRRTARLFHCDFACAGTLVFCVVTKTMFGCEKQFLNIKLSIENDKKQYQYVYLIGRTIPTQGQQDQAGSSVMNVYPINSSHSMFRDLQKYLLLNEPDFYIPVENSYDWTVRYYELTVPGSRVTAINCNTGLDRGSILLGHFGVCSMTTVRFTFLRLAEVVGSHPALQGLICLEEALDVLETLHARGD